MNIETKKKVYSHALYRWKLSRTKEDVLRTVPTLDFSTLGAKYNQKWGEFGLRSYSLYPTYSLEYWENFMFDELKPKSAH